MTFDFCNKTMGILFTTESDCDFTTERLPEDRMEKTSGPFSGQCYS